MAEQKPANQNPWYVLMTLHGEQTGRGTATDVELHEKNRAAWNAWSCQRMSWEEKEKAAKLSKVTVDELSAWDGLKDEVAERHEAEFKSRNGEDVAYPGLPDYRHGINLSEIAFANQVVLANVIFSADASFNGATFSAPASFANATFSAAASFDKVTFKGYPYFTGTIFGRPDTQDICRPDFADARFERPASFRDARFTTHYPVLAGTIFHDRTSFTAKPAHWPRVRDYAAHEPPWGRTDLQPAEVSRESCSVIRHTMTKQGLTEEAQFFFGREMRHAARASVPQWPFYALYWAWSDYGNAVWRPLLWLVALIVAGAVGLWNHSRRRRPIAPLR